jgi:hypothetical protein
MQVLKKKSNLENLTRPEEGKNKIKNNKFSNKYES